MQEFGDAQIVERLEMLMRLLVLLLACSLSTDLRSGEFYSVSEHELGKTAGRPSGRATGGRLAFGQRGDSATKR